MNTTIKHFEPNYEFMGDENALEKHVLDNLEIICKGCSWPQIKAVERQFRIKSGDTTAIIDIFVLHEDNSVTIIECKKTKTNRNDIVGAIGQVLFYSSIIEHVHKRKSRLVIASPQINPIVHSTISKYKLPIDLMMVDGDRCIYLSASH